MLLLLLGSKTIVRISSRTSHKYEGIRTSPLTKLALLISVFLILGTEIKDASKITETATTFRIKTTTTG